MPELLAVLADSLGVPKGNVTLVAGERSRNKTLRVTSLSANQAALRLGLSD